MSVVALVIAPSIALTGDSAYAVEANEKVWIDEDGKKHVVKGDMAMLTEEAEKIVKVNIEKNDDGTAKATVTTTTTKDGKTTTEDKVYEGTLEEVKAKLDALEDVGQKVEGKKKMIKKVIEEVEEEKS